MAQITDFTNFATEYPNYFPGQYLLEEDFQLEHKYLSDRLRYQNQSLHISGIVEGLNVELKEDRKSVLIKLGSAIDNQGNLIVLKSDTTFAEFNNINQGELYLQYSENKDVKQQNEVTDSYTRWRENPKLGFADTTPETGVKLAKITISEGNITDINAEIQDFSGLSLPNSNGKALTLRSAGNTNPNLAVLTGSLKLDGDLMVDGNVGIGTTTPSAPLEVQATNQTTPNNNGLYIFNPTNSNNQHAIVSVRVAGSDGGNPFVSWDVAGESGWAMGIDNKDNNKLKIGRNWNSLSANTSMTLDTRGNVGIGIATPGAKLEISGDLKLQSGVAVSNISNDVTLRDNNDLTIATAKAIKTYADTKALLGGSASQDFSVKNLASETLSFGSSVRQMINLWRTEFGIGVQGSTQYFRTAKNFAWYKAGNHDNNELNPGGGTVQMVIKDGNVGIGKAEPGAKLEVNGDIKVNGRLIGRLSINDTRSVNDKPTDFGKEVSFDFKSRTTVGVPGAGTYSGMLTIAPWGDNSGDAHHQLNFNEGGVFWRQGQPGAQAWGGWSKIANNGMTDAFSFGGNLDVQGITNTKNLEVTGALTINGDLKCNNGAVELNVFSDQDEDEWPKITWHRNTSNNWDEGLIKHSSSRGVFKKAGYGVHMNQSREFGIWSTNWNALFAVEGGTGNSYIKGDLQVGAKLEISGDLQLKNGVGVNKISNDVNLKENNNTTIATSKAIKTYADTKALLAGSSSQNFSAKNLSVLKKISLGQNSDVAQNSDAGIYWHTDSSYGIYRTPGAWTGNNFQQLKIHWATGIILQPGTGNNQGYNKSYVEIVNGKGLKVTHGIIQPSVGSSQNEGILFPKNPFGGSGDAAWIRYYRRGSSGENTTLEIGTGNDGGDHIALMPSSGNVGIGTNNPSAKLEVTGGTTKLQQEGWKTPNLQNNWVNYGGGYNPAGYFKDSMGIVHLRGLVRSGTGNIIFTLPGGYRPPAQELHVICTDPNVSGRVDIKTNGQVQRTVGSAGWVSLDGITFRAA